MFIHTLLHAGFRDTLKLDHPPALLHNLSYTHIIESMHLRDKLTHSMALLALLFPTTAAAISCSAEATRLWPTAPTREVIKENLRRRARGSSARGAE